jgi:hypothetical protein
MVARGYVELDAIDPNDLRDLVQAAIEQHLPPEQYEVLKAAEEERAQVDWSASAEGHQIGAND